MLYGLPDGVRIQVYHTRLQSLRAPEHLQWSGCREGSLAQTVGMGAMTNQIRFLENSDATTLSVRMSRSSRSSANTLDKKVCMYKSRSMTAWLVGEGASGSCTAVMIPLGREEAEASLLTAKTEIRQVPQPPKWPH